jgi:hypothetical protein
MSFVGKRYPKQQILLHLLDGEPHQLNEFSGYVLKGFDPAKSVKAYLNSFRPEAKSDASSAAPLSHQIEYGAKRRFKSIIAGMEKEKLIVSEGRDERGGYPDDCIVQLTMSGRRKMLGKAVWTGVCRELQRLLSTQEASLILKMGHVEINLPEGEEQIIQAELMDELPVTDQTDK